MFESTARELVRRGTAHASLAVLGARLQQLNLFAPIRDLVRIAQKIVRYAPAEKLYDAFIALLAGAQGIVELNTRLRAEPALQRAFGRKACAEQSVIQDTLNACTAANITEMEAALDQIYQRHSQGYRHPYLQRYQLLDADMTGMPCGKKAAFATKGYFAKQRNRRGRQLGRVLATHYQEIVVDRLFDGKTQLTTALQPLILAVERTLELDNAKRARTIVRVDAGGGTQDQVNWLLGRGYQVHAKEYSSQRAQKLARRVTLWVDDPHVPGRQVGWIEGEAPEYVRPVRRLAVRCPKANGEWAVGVLISTLTPATVLEGTGQPLAQQAASAAVLLAYVWFYDQRGGGVETANKGDKQGLGLTKRNKRRFEGQQMLVLLNQLAHNVLIWAKRWLLPLAPVVQRFGIRRLVRDAFGIGGTVAWEAGGRLREITLNQDHPLAPPLVRALQALIGADLVAVNLGQT